MLPVNRNIKRCLPGCLGLLAALALLPSCPKRTTCRTEQLSAKVRANRYDTETFQVMQKVLKADSVCVDVGAFKGNILAKMVESAPQGKHHAYEPIPKFAAMVRKRFPAPHITIHEMALAAKTGTTTFQHVTTNPAYSGLKKRGYPRKNEVVKKITVKVDTMDNTIPADTKVAFIKVDVEGGEYGVLAGGVKTIRRSKPIIVFEHGASSRKYGVTTAMLYKLLTETLGLKVNLMSCWLQGKPAFTAAQFQEQYSAGRNWYYIAYP